MNFLIVSTACRLSNRDEMGRYDAPLYPGRVFRNGLDDEGAEINATD